MAVEIKYVTPAISTSDTPEDHKVRVLRAHGHQDVEIRRSFDRESSYLDLHVNGPVRLAELRQVLSRALNTWDPLDVPPWALDLADMLDAQG